jgi:type IV pilus assembly protein PilV
VLLQDMVDRINSNRKNSMQYVTTGEGTDKAEQDCSAMTGATLDLCEWSNALLGASESAGGLKVGAMKDARGCVEALNPNMPREFLITIAWQGMSPTKEPGGPGGAGLACGVGLYGPDGYRRAITSHVIIGCLQNNVVSGACITP